ncbi:hypothetical protein J7J47_10975 [Halomonas sp. ISL-60]|uniref:hypothetical protein n=1 Tax=Halomonas sp. ISL-56 TaxID=2819149 RepID=UPI001BEA8BAF|nr:hypothetical protein [Halomonas sp. ISL-56]MBT2772749.1 hypothetical protein [Halomonas sp. ISL-60]MBT2800544.1 hypothetical protein [Halomonas sp. ISL-56]
MDFLNIDNLSFTDPEDLNQNNLDYISTISDPEVFIGMLDKYISDLSLLKLVADRSYRHINHFDKIVLFDNGDPNSFRLTMHLWQPPYTIKEQADEQIHSHRFSFWSSVLCGTLISEDFEECESGQPYESYSYCPENKDLKNFYTHEGPVKLKKTTTVRAESSTSYFLRNLAIHRIVVPDTDPVVTLVLRSPRVRNHSVVYNSKYPKNDLSYENSFFSVEETKEKLTLIKNLLIKRLENSG